MGAMGNASYGWWGSGDPSGTVLQRIDFSNDTATASRRADRSTA